MTGLEKFIDAMRKDGRSDYGTVMQLALSILSEEKATATAKCVSGHDGGCPWYIPGSNPPSRHAADEPLAEPNVFGMRIVEDPTMPPGEWKIVAHPSVIKRAYLNGLNDKKENI